MNYEFIIDFFYSLIIYNSKHENGLEFISLYAALIKVCICWILGRNIRFGKTDWFDSTLKSKWRKVVYVLSFVHLLRSDSYISTG